jgi:hypothetical protein
MSDLEERKTKKELNMENYHKALEKYMDLKNKYEKTIDKKRNDILNRDISKKNKKKIFKSLVGNCINCKRNVGTIFRLDNNTYIALCGSKDSPCDLNIKIKKPEIIDIYDTYYSSLEEQDKLTENIIKINYSLIFGFVSEEEIKNSINDMKNMYNELVGDNELYYNLFTDILENPEKKELVENSIYELNENVNDIKELLNEYRVTNNSELIRDAIEIYINNVKTLEKKIRDNKYSYIDMEEDINDKNKSKLVKSEITYKQREFIINEASIIT